MNHFVWNVSPEIFSLGPFAPRWYGFFFAFGFVLGYWILVRIYRNERRPEETLSSLFMHIFLGTLIGARLGHVLFYQPDYYLWRPWEILMIWQGGLASHGGFAGVLIGIYLYQRRFRDMSFLDLCDRLAIAILPAAAMIRFGNFFNSEILGIPSSLPWAVVFARVSPLPRHPAMLYEALAYLLIFAVFYAAYWKTDLKKIPGRLLGAAFATAFTARFLIEFVKEHQAPFERDMAVNMGQALSIPFILVGLYLLLLKPPAGNAEIRTRRMDRK